MKIKIYKREFGWNQKKRKKQKVEFGGEEELHSKTTEIQKVSFREKKEGAEFNSKRERQ